MISKTQAKRMMKLDNRDFQNRGGEYPDSDRPDTIRVYQVGTRLIVKFSFKSPDSEEFCEEWVKNYINVPAADAFGSRQTGDYNLDWVDVTVEYEVK